MLNLEMIDNLYASLSKEQQQALIAQLFKKSKQTMSYFHRTKDISLSKLETLSEYAKENNSEKTVEMLSEIVPTFHHKTNEKTNE